MKKVFILVLDSLGVGQAPDANNFGDEGANTLGNIAKFCFENGVDFSLPHLESLGLGLANFKASGIFPKGLNENPKLIGSYAYAKELSSGKDTPSGHWEIAGVPVLFEWGYFKQKTNSFPHELLQNIVKKAKLNGFLGNCHASGTAILDDLGEEHIATKKPIFYTSADSVFQIAAHEKYFGLQNLYDLCKIARTELEPYNIGRVIARPFIGECVGEFKRTGNRKDYAVEPPQKTILQHLCESGGEVISVGKIADIFAHTGITQKLKATGIDEIFDKTIEAIKTSFNKTIVFSNFVNFDSDFGHRRDALGYAKELMHFDQRLPEILKLIKDDDLLIITADHGCDPTFKGTDHTREFIPILLYGKDFGGEFLGKRESFADIAQTIASYFDLEKMNYGEKINYKKEKK